jgi:hypothetical protein
MWHVYLTAPSFESMFCGSFKRRSDAEAMQAAANRLFARAWVRVVFEPDQDQEIYEDMQQLDTEQAYERMQKRLKAFDYGLRRGTDSRLFYATNVRLVGSESYRLKWSEPRQAWDCSPIVGNAVEAARVLAIALGEIQP